MSEAKTAAIAVVALVIGLVIALFIPYVTQVETITETETIAPLTVPFAPSTTRLEPIADANVYYAMPDDNWGAREELYVKNAYLLAPEDEKTTTYTTYIMFDLSPIPTNASVTSAQLYLKTWDVSGVIEVGGYHCVDSSWSERGITWNNAPAFDEKASSIVTVSDSDQWYSWDISEALNAALKTEKLTIVLYSELRRYSKLTMATFYSRETVNKPRLEVSYGLIERSTTSTTVTSTNYVTSVECWTTSTTMTMVETKFLITTVTETATLTTPSQLGTWHKVATFKGTYSKTTDLFEVKGERFRLTWTISGAGKMTVFSFLCYPEGETTIFVGNPIMVTGSKETSDSTIVYEGPGRYYLLVNAGNLDEWEITVEDFY